MDDIVERRCLSQNGKSQVFGLEVMRDAEKQVQMIRENIKIA
jgi:hypothetical protein